MTEQRTNAAGDAVKDAASPARASAQAAEEVAEAVYGGGATALEGEVVAEELDALSATAAQRDEYLALAQRTQADFENYRKRVAREASAAEARGLARLARELLPALDNLDRALAHAQDADADAVLMDGLRLVHRELMGSLERVGISTFGEVGEEFDPEFHEAVAQQPFEGFAPGLIVEVYQPGYRLSGGVIRAARVLVAG